MSSVLDVGRISNKNLKGDSKSKNFMQRVEMMIMTRKRLSAGSVSSIGSVGSSAVPAWPQAISQARPSPNRPGQAGPKWLLPDGFGLASILKSQG
jgi:hypothetical protein